VNGCALVELIRVVAVPIVVDSGAVGRSCLLGIPRREGPDVWTFGFLLGRRLRGDVKCALLFFNG
jgi:hypothetical protein